MRLDGFDPYLIKRAAIAIQKRQLWQPRPKLYLQKQDVFRIVSKFSSDIAATRLCMLFLAAYVFLLRVPSEALVMCYDRVCREPEDRKSVLIVRDDSVSLHLKSRKNTSERTVITRYCWCNKVHGSALCPVHTLGVWAAKHSNGSQLFYGISCASTVSSLRNWLRELGYECAYAFRPHDFRRGHSKDLQDAGASVEEIMREGGWRGPGFLPYISRNELERDIVIDAHRDESSDDEEVPLADQERGAVAIDVESVETRREIADSKLRELRSQVLALERPHENVISLV